MSIGVVNNDRGFLNAAGFSAQAAAFAGQGGQGEFEEALKSSMGFGSRGEAGGAVSAIAAGASSAGDLLSQLQFAFLKNNEGQSALAGRLNNALF